jgi:hypothetical protein
MYLVQFWPLISCPEEQTNQSNEKKIRLVSLHVTF